jgi:hypothetical protein
LEASRAARWAVKRDRPMVGEWAAQMAFPTVVLWEACAVGYKAVKKDMRSGCDVG